MNILCWAVFAGDLTHEVWPSLLISSLQYANEGSGCHPINYNNWTVIPNRRVPPVLSLYSPFLYISWNFHQFMWGGLFPVFIYSANLNAVEKTLLTRYCHVSSDESCALMKKQFSWDQGTWPFKCEQMTAHLFLFTSWCLNPTVLLHQRLTHITAALGWGLQVWMTPQGNRFTACCYARSI